MITTAERFTFNGKYDDYNQVAQFIGDFTVIRRELIESPVGYAYNDDFRGRIPGIANTTKRGPSVGSHEDAAIYMLQTLYRWWELEARLLGLKAEGAEAIETMGPAEVARFKLVVLYPTRDMGGEHIEIPDARIMADENGKPAYVLRKGARTLGTLIDDRGILVVA